MFCKGDDAGFVVAGVVVVEGSATGISVAGVKVEESTTRFLLPQETSKMQHINMESRRITFIVVCYLMNFFRLIFFLS